MGNETVEGLLQTGNMSPIQQFYHNKTIFITGGTGFLGKIIIDKLIRSCSVNKIYILVRSKKGKNPQTRLEELFRDKVFNRLKKECPNYLDLVTLISGDCSLPNLGLLDESIRLLQEKIEVIFHCAATVRFDEKLPMAVNINIRALRDLIEIAHSMPKLEVIVHVSTAYTYATKPIIEEKFYQPPISPDNLIKLIECAGDKLCEDITPKVIGEWPNTYTFTKAIAESLLQSAGKGLPMVLFRPAIIIGTAEEPVPGWIDNIYGPTGVVVGVGTGLLRVMLADPDTVSALVPVDYVVNSMLACAWDRAKNRLTTLESPVYNYVSTRQNPITYGDFLKYNFVHGSKIPSAKAVWCYSLRLTKYRFMYEFYTLFLHTLPAAIIDSLLVLSRNKPKALKIYKKIHRFTDVLAYFSTKTFYFDGDAVDRLWDRLAIEDKRIYKFDMAALDWNEYFKTSVHGIREYLLQDPPETVEEGRLRYKKFLIFHKAIKYVFVFLIIYMFYKVLSSLLF